MAAFTLRQRLASARHALSLALGERLRFSLGRWQEVPCGSRAALVEGLDAGQRAALEAVWQQLPGTAFELSLARPTALANYDLAQRLLGLWAAAGRAVPAGGDPVLHEVGCANFRTVAALHAFFRPRELVGIEIEGWRRYATLRSRHDHATAYAAQVPGARFAVADYADFGQPADVICAFFPFVTPAPVLAWRLPLSVLQPARLFGRIAANLRPGGVFVMANQGEDEAAVAAGHATAAGLVRCAQWLEARPLLPRPVPAVLSLWQGAGGTIRGPNP